MNSLVDSTQRFRQGTNICLAALKHLLYIYVNPSFTQALKVPQDLVMCFKSRILNTNSGCSPFRSQVSVAGSVENCFSQASRGKAK
jgi:hypothetical protein